jgi:Helicase conserved C-terminal domain
MLAAECMSQSARGLSREDTEGWPHVIRDAYTKLAAGHVSTALKDMSDLLKIPEADSISEAARSKIVRVKYWYRQLETATRTLIEAVDCSSGMKSDPYMEHPRILKAVNEIENWTVQREASRREKVLVFGVYLQPLRLLQNVLNVRHALRAADAGKPVAHVVQIHDALRQIDRLRSEGALTHRLKTVGAAEVGRVLAESHKTYETLRRSARDEVKKRMKAWFAQGGFLGDIPLDGAVKGALQDHLVSFALDDFLESLSTAEVHDRRQLRQWIRERLDGLVDEFKEARLRPLFGELDDDTKKKDPSKLRKDALRRAMVEDHDGRQSLHARLLWGKTGWETRRYLQAAFNKPRAAPWILIAQSQVGREGLNLHESCRVVMQFHAEWNPAILEQQVGRVDRKRSRWEQLAQEWIKEPNGDSPLIEVRQLIFEGTYDAYQWDRVMQRKHMFDASLFGSLLPPDAWSKVPQDQLNELIAAAPSFNPATPARQTKRWVVSNQPTSIEIDLRGELPTTINPLGRSSLPLETSPVPRITP